MQALGFSKLYSLHDMRVRIASDAFGSACRKTAMRAAGRSINRGEVGAQHAMAILDMRALESETVFFIEHIDIAYAFRGSFNFGADLGWVDGAARAAAR